MPKHTVAEEFRHHASQVRLIAEGLFDQTERKQVLLFVDDCERRFARTRRVAAPRSPN